MNTSELAESYMLDPKMVNVIKKQSNPDNSFSLAKKIAELIVSEAEKNKYSNADILTSLYFLIYTYHKTQIDRMMKK